MRTDLTIIEAAELTGRHPETLRRAARDGTLPGCYRLGHLWLIRREIFDAIRNGKPGGTGSTPPVNLSAPFADEMMRGLR